MAHHRCQYDYVDPQTLLCKECKSVIILLITPRERILRSLADLGMLRADGKAWREEKNYVAKTVGKN
jgi:hypothetical protein